MFNYNIIEQTFNHEGQNMCEHEQEEEENKFIIPKIILTVILFICGYKFNLLFYVAYLVIGYDILWKAIKNILKGKMFDECFFHLECLH